MKKTHKVKSGEKLSAIAKKYGLTATELAKYNGIKRPYKLKRNQSISIPVKQKSKGRKKETTPNPNMSNEQFYLKLIVFILFVIFVTLSIKLYQMYNRPHRQPTTAKTVVIEQKDVESMVAVPDQGKKVTSGAAQIAVSAVVKETAENKKDVEVEAVVADKSDVVAVDKLAVEAVVGEPDVKTTFAVTILNGNGIKGAANKLRNILLGEDYQIASTANADNFNYDTSIIEYEPELESSAMDIAETMVANGYDPITAENMQLEGITVTLGKK